MNTIKYFTSEPTATATVLSNLKNEEHLIFHINPHELFRNSPSEISHTDYRHYIDHFGLASPSKEISQQARLFSRSSLESHVVVGLSFLDLFLIKEVLFRWDFVGSVWKS